MTPSHPLPPLPQSWSALTWQQLCTAWQAKQRYGGNADVAAVAAMMALYGLRTDGAPTVSDSTGETIYRLSDADGRLWITTPRELAHLAHEQMAWFHYPYGDPGDREERDEKGNIVRERREPHPGYVSQMRDAMILPLDEIEVSGKRFAMPQLAMNNLTWHQYRSLQAVAPQLFQDGITDQQALQLQAQFLGYILVPAAEEPAATADTFAKRHQFKYNADRAEVSVAFWQQQLEVSSSKFQVSSKAKRSRPETLNLKPETSASVLFHICFQVYQTAVAYYAQVFPLLFGGSADNDPLHDALTSEVNTINSVMKYQGYSDPQQVYDANLPIILGVLNNMTKEAKEIEKMNSKIKRR